MDTGCSLGQQREWVVVTHPDQVIGCLADTSCQQSGVVSRLEPQSTNTSGVVRGHKPQSRNLGGWRIHPEIMNEGTKPLGGQLTHQVNEWGDSTLTQRRNPSNLSTLRQLKEGGVRDPPSLMQVIAKWKVYTQASSPSLLIGRVEEGKEKLYTSRGN